MNNKAEIRREVEKEVSSFSAKDLFSSPYFAEMLQATVTAVCEKLGRIPNIECICDEKSDLTAATNGLVIIQNTQGPLIRDMDSNWKMYVSNIGHVVHETGHILFTDFVHQNQMFEHWIYGKEFAFYPSSPNVNGAKELAEFLSDNPMVRLLYAKEMRSIVNVLEDAYVENRLRANFSGLATAGLTLVNDEMYRKSEPLSLHLKSVLEGKLLPLQIAESILLTRYVEDKPLKSEGLSEDQKILYEQIELVLSNTKKETDELVFTQDGLKRCELFNSLFVKLFSLMPLPRGEKGEGEKEGSKDPNENFQSGSSDFSKEEAKEKELSMDSFTQSLGSSSMPRGNSEGIKQENSKEEDSQKDMSSALLASQNAMNREYQNVLREVVTKKVVEDAERKHTKDLKNEVQQIECNVKKIAQFSSFTGYRLTRANPNKPLYDKIYKEVVKTSKNLTRKINNILKERETDSVESGFLMGQRFNASDVVRRDGKYFSRQIVPDGKAEVVFGVLIDESGSMNYADKYVRARKAAILLEDALRNLGIPLLIAGHTEEEYGECLLHIYADFDTCDGKDMYRLSSISAVGGNIDGAAITYMGEKMLKRKEKIKVLIVISDGLPAGCSFYDENANEDTKKAIEVYRKKGINVFGAVVDSFEQVSKLYDENYCFDCREPEALEKQLIRLIKRYVLMQ